MTQHEQVRYRANWNILRFILEGRVRTFIQVPLTPGPLLRWGAGGVNWFLFSLPALGSGKSNVREVYYQPPL